MLATITDKKIGVPSTSNSSLIDHYEADVQSAQDYYPFGMLMPGRSGYAVPGGWASSSTTTSSVASQLTLSSRRSNTPADYTATESIEFTTGFESGVNDAFETFLVDGSSGSGGSGSGSGFAGGGYRYGFNGKENDNEVKGEGNQQDYGMRIYDPRLSRFLSVDPIADEYPQLTPYQFASNQPIESVDMDGLERLDYRAVKGDDGKAKLGPPTTGPKEGKSLWGTYRIPQHARVEYNGQTYIFADGRKHEDVSNTPGIVSGVGNEGVYYAADLNKFKEDPDAFVSSHKSQEELFQEQLTLGLVIAEGAEVLGESTQLKIRSAPKTNTSVNKPAVQQQIVATPNITAKQKAARQLAVNKANSLASEAIVEASLEKTLGPNEILIKKPRIYIGDGKDKKDYAVPDFAVYNTKSNAIVRIPDAKNGGASLTGQQKRLNELVFLQGYAFGLSFKLNTNPSPEN